MSAKKHKLSKLSDKDEEFLAKFSTKQRSMAVDGKPDQSDVDNLTRLFDTYDKYTGGGLRKFIRQNMVERTLNQRGRDITPVATAERLAFAMPKDLQSEVEKYWPSIWTNPDHLRWFLTKFPMFRR